MRRVKRMLMYSQDGMGLGHLRRSANIANKVLGRHPRCEILILADSPAASVQPLKPGLEILKLPTIVKTGSASAEAGCWRNAFFSSDIHRMIRLRAAIIKQAFVEFEPDAVLIDHMPVGALGELKPMLHAAISRLRPPRLFLGLRDILDEPSVIRRAWDELDAYAYLGCYDSILVYGCSAIHDSTAAYGLLPHARRVVFCNYVSPDQAEEPLRRPLTEDFLLMMGGGGSDAYTLAEAFVEAFPALHDRLGVRAVILTGPNMGAEERDGLIGRAPLPIDVQGSFESAHPWIENASAVITLGGYNSLCEVMKWGKKALVVPRPGPSAEQLTRSRLFADRGLMRMLHPAALSAERLADEVTGLLEDPATPDLARMPLLDGAERAADVILGEVGEDHATRAALNGHRAATERLGEVAVVVDDNGRRDALVPVARRDQ